MKKAFLLAVILSFVGNALLSHGETIIVSHYTQQTELLDNI